MIDIDISILEPAWETESIVCDALVNQALEATFKHSPIAQALITNGIEPEISVVLANDDLVQTLNREYRDKDKPTNVLSFAMLDGDDGWQAPQQPGPCALGDLILAYETVKREALDEGKPFGNHLCHLIVHGTLHLLGYDHEDDANAETMETLEKEILRDIDIPDPYKDE